MDRLESKKINGRVYYYFSQWGWKDGKCRRLRQKYLGSLHDLAAAAGRERDAPLWAEVYQWGLPMALWQEAVQAKLVPVIDELCPKRRQGLSFGEYLALAAINRAIRPSSKRSMWEWFSRTSLVRHFPRATAEALSSQRFWDHMEQLDETRTAAIWQAVLRDTLRRERVDTRSISYDGTNFYTFIDTFNTRGELARRGKNKQGRDNLRQVNYALFCCADGPLPLFYAVYEGNRNDARQFPVMLDQFQAFCRGTLDQSCDPAQITLVFDKGNNSAANFARLDAQQWHYVGSVKLGEHKDLAAEENGSARFTACQDPALAGVKAFRVRRLAYGRERTLVVTCNPQLFAAQQQTVQADLDKALGKMRELALKLEAGGEDRASRGRRPRKDSVTRQIAAILSRQHLKELVTYQLEEGPGGLRLRFQSVPAAFEHLQKTVLGKTVLVTDRDEWDNDRIIRAYRSQYLLEGVFREMKDRRHGSWWPLYHWTDSKIRVHGLYCSLALLLRGLMMRRLARQGVRSSLGRVLSELGQIQEIVNVYPPPDKKGPGRRKAPAVQRVLSKMTEVQQELVQRLGLKENLSD